MKIQFIKMLHIALIMLVTSTALSGCNGGDSMTNGAGNGITMSANQLIANNTNPVPLVNGNQVKYSTTISNLGATQIAGISWNYSQSPKIANLIVNSDSCNNIAANDSCQIQTLTDAPGNYVLTGSVNGKTVITVNTSVYTYTASNSQEFQNALTILHFTPTLLVKQTNNSGNPVPQYVGFMPIYITNNYKTNIDVHQLFSDLPNGVSYSSINCPNPLSYGYTCEVVFKYNGNINSDITVFLKPKGSIINSDGTKTQLPQQSSTEKFIISKNDILNVLPQDAVSLNFTYQDLMGSSITYLTGTQKSGSNRDAKMIIKNNGTTALTSMIFPTVPGIKFTPDITCNTLAPQSSCNVAITLSLDNIINIHNLDSYKLNYTYVNQPSEDISFNYLRYNVVGVGQPNIQYTTNLVNCGLGSMTNGSGPYICNLNKKDSCSVAGCANLYKFVVTYTNLGQADVSDFKLIESSIPNNYDYGGTTCNDKLKVDGNCDVIYNLLSPSSDKAYTLDTGTIIGAYTNGLLQTNIDNPTQTVVDIFSPGILSIPSAVNLAFNPSGESFTVVFTAVGWYIATKASFELTYNPFIETSHSCVQPYDISCTYNFSAESLSVGNYDIIATFSKDSGFHSSTTVPVKITVPAYFIPYYPHGCRLPSESGNAQICTCVQDPTTYDVWYANIFDTPYVRWNDANTWATNLQACGITNGWGLPSMDQLMTLSEYLTTYGKAYNPYFYGDWLNLSFSGIQRDSHYYSYWGPLLPNSDDAWFIFLFDGSIRHAYIPSNFARPMAVASPVR